MVSNALEPGWICATFLLGGLTVILVSRKSIPMSLRDISPTGAAWVLGTVKSLVLALIVGLILGTLAQFLNVLRLTSALHGVGPVARMYLTPGLPQVAVFVAGVFLCPTVEEILFRGVVYGGYRRSFGAGAAAMLTTALFTIWHIPEYIHFWPGLVVVVAEGLAALSFRLHWGAIGPAIAVHTGCNLATVAFVFIASFLR
jgi:membrane protease YdiL (CAAX protease family)